MKTNVGLDYSCPGSMVNRNPETGIRYGIARIGDLADWAVGEFEPVYSASCPECGDSLPEDFDTDNDTAPCGHAVSCAPDDWYPDEPDRLEYVEDGLSLILDESNDVWIFESPVTTTGIHCSPCAPGAVSVYREPVEDGPTAYGLPAEWWRDDV